MVEGATFETPHGVPEGAVSSLTSLAPDDAGRAAWRAAYSGECEIARSSTRTKISPPPVSRQYTRQAEKLTTSVLLPTTTTHHCTNSLTTTSLSPLPPNALFYTGKKTNSQARGSAGDAREGLSRLRAATQRAHQDGFAQVHRPEERSEQVL